MMDFFMWLPAAGIAVLAVVMVADELELRAKRNAIERMTGPGEFPEEGELDYGNKDVAI